MDIIEVATLVCRYGRACGGFVSQGYFLGVIIKKMRLAYPCSTLIIVDDSGFRAAASRVHDVHTRKLADLTGVVDVAYELGSCR